MIPLNARLFSNMPPVFILAANLQIDTRQAGEGGREMGKAATKRFEELNQEELGKLYGNFVVYRDRHCSGWVKIGTREFYKRFGLGPYVPGEHPTTLLVVNHRSRSGL